jgi:ABC-2 type transport system ATP-binding protein
LLKVKDKLHVQLRRLSLGERMKMEFIGALLHKPKVLFLDEPTIGLDVVAQLSIREFIKHYNRENKTTIILTSHYMQDIEALCERVMIIDGGKLFFDGALSEIVDKFSSEKFLTLDFYTPIEHTALSEFGKIEHFNGLSVKLRVPRQHISKISAEILSRFDVQDLTIEEVPIEDIIRTLFSREHLRS